MHVKQYLVSYPFMIENEPGTNNQKPHAHPSIMLTHLWSRTQWLDNSSYAFLKQVMLRAVFPLLVVLTTRNDEVEKELAEVSCIKMIEFFNS